MRLAVMTVLAALAAFPAFAETPATPGAEPGKVCMEVYQPVCATKAGEHKTYSNECFAKIDGATEIKPGRCSPGG